MVHPVMVAHILADMRMDMVAMETGLLHDVVEDTSVTVEQVRKEFGEEVARCVDGVTKLSKLDFFSAEDRQAESFRKMLLAMVEDIRVIMVKLADRMHNMRTLGYLARETPRAHRARDHRNLRAHRAPPGNGQGPRRAGGPGVPAPGAGSVPGDPARHRVPAPFERGVPRRDPPDGRGRTAARGHPGARRRPRQAALLGLSEDARQKITRRPGLRPDGAAHHHRLGEELLRRAGRDPQRVASHPRPHQGLHRHSAAQPLPVAAHFRGGPARPDLRGADPHRGDAPHRRGRHRRALEVQGGPQGPGRRRPAHRLAAPPGRMAARHAGPRRVHVHPQGGPVPGGGLHLHAARQGDRAAARRHAHRFRLRHPLRCRPHLRRRQGERPHRAAALHAAQRRHRRDHDAARPRAQQGLAGLRQDLARAQQDQARHQRQRARQGHRDRPEVPGEGGAPPGRAARAR